MNAAPLSPGSKREYRAAVLLSYLVSTAMLVCLTFALVQLTHRIFPLWANQYLLAVSAVVALEGMLASRSLRDYAVLTPDWFFFRATEWVVLLVSLKALIYLLNDPAQILVDVLEWDEHFLDSFFTPEYAAVVLFSFMIWILAVQLGHFILDLEASVEELELESQGLVVKDRTRLRRSLEAMIFGVGMLMMILMALNHTSLGELPPSTVSLRTSVLVLLAYFFLGFILLAQTQFFIQRARWYLQNVPASPKIGQRWALYSLVLIGAIALAVSLLPTGYSAEFFRWLQLAVGFLMGLVTYLFLLLITPILYLLQLISRMIRPGRVLPTPPLAPPAPPEVMEEPDMIWMLLKSILFWTVFFSVIFFSFRFYIQQHPEAWERFKQRPGIRWLLRAAAWLARRWRRARRRVEAAVEGGVERLRAETRRRRIRLPDFSRLARRLPARAQVLILYREMLRWNAQNGIRRGRNQTPYEYARMLVESIPAAQPEVEAITSGFMEARYTRHEIRREDADRVRENWNRLKQRLRLQIDLPDGEKS